MPPTNKFFFYRNRVTDIATPKRVIPLAIPTVALESAWQIVKHRLRVNIYSNDVHTQSELLKLSFI
jgi:hypothetical protein